MKKIVLACLILLGCAAGVTASILTFDDLNPTTTPLTLTQYNGFTWSNFNAVNPALIPENTGFLHGTISGNVITNGNGDPATVSSTNLFNFSGAYFTAAYNDGLSVTVTGYKQSQQLYQSTFSVDTVANTPLYVALNFAGIDSVRFSASGGTTPTIWNRSNSSSNMVIDNFTYTYPEEPATVPEPSTLLLLGAGTGAVLLFRRRS